MKIIKEELRFEENLKKRFDVIKNIAIKLRKEESCSKENMKKLWKKNKNDKNKVN